MKTIFIGINCADPDEMQQFAALHLGLPNTKGIVCTHDLVFLIVSLTYLPTFTRAVIIDSY